MSLCRSLYAAVLGRQGLSSQTRLNRSKVVAYIFKSVLKVSRPCIRLHTLKNNCGDAAFTAIRCSKLTTRFIWSSCENSLYRLRYVKSVCMTASFANPCSADKETVVSKCTRRSQGGSCSPSRSFRTEIHVPSLSYDLLRTLLLLHPFLRRL